MKAFLLAAGLGTRLRPLTDSTPKCLLPIAGVPLLEIWLRHLEEHRVDEVLVNTHWLHGQVEVYLAARPPGRVKVRVFYEEQLLGSAGTLWANRDWVNREPFYIIYGDNLTRVDLGAMLAFHRAHQLPLTLGVFKAPDPRRAGIVTLDDDGTVTRFIEKPARPESDLGAAGIYVADFRIFEYFKGVSLPAGSPLDLSYHILPALAGRMKAYLLREPLIDIGTPESYALAQQNWAGRAGH